MNILDILIVIFLLLWIIRGYFSGFSFTLTNLLGLICGITGAMIFSPTVAKMMDGYIKNQLIRELIAYFLIFFIITTTFRIIGIVMKKTLLKYKLRDVDSYMGALVSGLEAILLISIVILLFTWGPWETTRNMVGESKFAPAFYYVSRVIISNLPEDVQRQLQKKMNNADVEVPDPQNSHKPKKPAKTGDVKRPEGI